MLATGLELIVVFSEHADDKSLTTQQFANASNFFIISIIIIIKHHLVLFICL